MSTSPPGPEQPQGGGWQPPSGAQWGQPQQAGGPQWGQPLPQNPDTNGKAITAFVLGLGGIFICPVILSVAAIVLGGQARGEIAGSQGQQKGQGLAKAGVILGWISLALTLLFIIAIVAFGVFAEDSDDDGGSGVESDPVNVITFAGDALTALGGLL